MNRVDRLPREIGQGGEVGLAGQRLGLEPPHLAGGADSLVTARPPTIQRIAGSWPRRSASLTSSYPARRPNTPELRCQGVAVVLAGPAVGQYLPGHLGQAKGIIKLPKGEQPGVGVTLEP
jgi:hypothetical protein